MEQKLSIFPYKAKLVGLALILLSVPFAYLYFWGGRPEIFTVKVFAVITNYLETRYFTLAQTNILDELAAIFFIFGVALISFSKEKTEKKHFETLRIKALINAMYITLIFWLLSLIFVYGIAILMVSFFVFIVFLITFNLLFRVYIFKYNAR